jgi:hypothetical protein
MLADLPASPAQIARHLGIQPSTLATYTRQGQAPRSIMLALFWETRWGRSAADTEAANWGALHYRQHMGAARELERMAGIIWTLEQEQSQASSQAPGRAANSPVYRVR